MTVATDLYDLALLRSTPQYYAAEVARRGTAGGAAAMAKAPHSDPLYGQVRLLIGTWETIARRINAEKKNSPLRIGFYESTPIWQMWNALAPAIEIIRGAEFKGKGSRFYAMAFETLATHYKKEWFDKQGPDYQTAAEQGINAQFG